MSGDIPAALVALRCRDSRLSPSQARRTGMHAWIRARLQWKLRRQSWQGSASSTSRYPIGEARQYHLLYIADVGAHEKGSARNVPRLECLYDVIGSVRGALRELPAHICDCATELDLQRKPRQRLDECGISGLLGDIFVKFPIAHSIGFNVSVLQGDHGFNEYIFKPPDVAVAHWRDGELNRETFEPLV